MVPVARPFRRTVLLLPRRARHDGANPEHNDIDSFIMMLDGEALLVIDVGICTYPPTSANRIGSSSGGSESASGHVWERPRSALQGIGLGFESLCAHRTHLVDRYTF